MEKNTEGAKLFEDTDITLDAPYNMPLQHIFNENYRVQIIKENGQKIVVRLRRKPSENQKP